MKKVEIVLWCGFVASILMKIFIEAFFVGVLVFGLSLVVFYCRGAYFLLSHPVIISPAQLLKRKASSGRAGSIVTGILYALVVISIILKIFHLPGTAALVFQSLIALIVYQIVCIVRYRKSKDRLYREIMIKNFVFIAGSCLLAIMQLLSI